MPESSEARSVLPTITQPCLLIVEGKDDKLFMEALAATFDPRLTVEVREVRGKEKLGDELTALLNSSGFENVRAYGIITDADNSAAAAFQRIQDVLKKLGQPCPKAVGQVATAAGPRVGVFLLPGDSDRGCLEDLCLRTVRAHPLMPCVEEYLACLKRVCGRKPDGVQDGPSTVCFPKNESKAKALAFLAGMYDPPKEIGRAAQRGYWDLTHPALNHLRGFVKALCAL